MFTYLKPNKTAGYSGFVIYRPANSYCNDDFVIWMIPGTYFLDWDN